MWEWGISGSKGIFGESKWAGEQKAFPYLVAVKYVKFLHPQNYQEQSRQLAELQAQLKTKEVKNAEF